MIISKAADGTAGIDRLAEGGHDPAIVGSTPAGVPTFGSAVEPPGVADLGARDLRSVLEFTERIATVSDPSDVSQMLAGLADLVGADTATLTRIDLRSGHEVAVLWPESRVNPAVLAGYAAGLCWLATCLSARFYCADTPAARVARLAQETTQAAP